jgi:cytochrome c-type biogenesis protein CcmH
MIRRLLLILAAFALMGAAASDPAERLSDPAREARARALFQQIRCVVCQNQSIDESDADLARDLRVTVRQEIAQGQSDVAIRAFLVHRYGEFILLKPQWSLGNAALWLGPFLVLLIAGGVLVLRARPSQPPGEDLSADEEVRLKQIREI